MRHLKFIFTAILFFGANLIFAAPAPPPSTSSTGGPSCWPPPCVPIDNGIIFLIIAGAIFGAKKLYDLRKKSEIIS